MIGGILGLIAYSRIGDWRWFVGALVLLANWPYTFIAIKPVNDALKKTQASAAGPDARRLVVRWGTLHAGRSALGTAAVLLCIWAIA
jgi:hypothetical protein